MKPLCFQSLKTLFRKLDTEIVLYPQQKWNINCQYKGVYAILAQNGGSSFLYFLIFLSFRADRVRPLSEGTKALYLSNKSTKTIFLIWWAEIKLPAWENRHFFPLLITMFSLGSVLPMASDRQGSHCSVYALCCSRKVSAYLFISLNLSLNVIGTATQFNSVLLRCLRQ